MTTIESDVRHLSRLCKALADETRLRIVALLAHGELCVCHLHEVLRLPQPNVSRQLGILRAAGVVADRREGSWVHYRLLPQADPVCAKLLRGLVRGFAEDAAMRRVIDRAVKSKGPKPCVGTR